MRSKRLKMVGAATVGALALSVTGLAGTAQADLADDLQIMAGNIPAAVDALVDGAQRAVDNLAAGSGGYPVTQLLLDTGDAASFAVGALAAGTEQFGSLGFGAAILFGGTVSMAFPLTIPLDEDPASVLDVVGSDDVAALVSNVPTALAVTQPWIMQGLISLLEGNLIDTSGPFPGAESPAVVGDTLAALTVLMRALSEGTFMAEPLGFTFGFMMLVPAVAVSSYVQDLEDGLAPIFEALAPVTTPLAEALAG